jgi:hypothetical protein
MLHRKFIIQLWHSVGLSILSTSYYVGTFDYVDTASHVFLNPKMRLVNGEK